MKANYPSSKLWSDLQRAVNGPVAESSEANDADGENNAEEQQDNGSFRYYVRVNYSVSHEYSTSRMLSINATAMQACVLRCERT